MEEFTYKPEVIYSEISSTDVEVAKPFWENFRKGYLLALEPHLINAKGLQDYLSSSEVTPPLRILFNSSAKDIDSALTRIMRQFGDLEQTLSDANIEKESRKFYFNFFQTSDIEEKKLRFCEMSCEYKHLKIFYQNVLEDWQIVQKIFEALPSQNSTHEFLQKVLAFRVYPRLELCEQTDLLLRRIAYVLQLKDGDEKIDTVNYSVKIDYTFDSLFIKNIEELFDKAVQEKEAAPQKDFKEINESCLKSRYHLDARGQIMFNQSELYVLNIDKQKLEEHKKRISQCKFIENRVYANEEESKRDIIRGLLLKEIPDQEKIYENFLLAYLPRIQKNILANILAAEPAFSQREQDVLVYHFTPSYFYKLLLYSLQQEHCGYIHFYRGGRRMTRELPYECIKFFFSDWWDMNVFQKTQKADRNSFEIIARIHNAVAALWQKEKDILEKIQKDPLLAKAFQQHEYHTLKPFLEAELSMFSYLLFWRFIGHDFIYS